jgi:exonuclease III
MRVLAWNVDGTFPPQGSPTAIDNQIQWLDSLEKSPDVLLLQEVNPNRGEYWKEVLRERLGYQSFADTTEQARELGNSNGHITAAQNGLHLSDNRFSSSLEQPEDEGRSLPETTYPEKILITDLETADSTIEVCNVRAVPGGDYPEEKLNIFELVYDYIRRGGSKSRLLAGDLNTPKRELSDGQAVTYGYERKDSRQDRGVNAELKILKGLGHFGMIDVFRALHGYGDIEAVDTSHNGRRIDHLFASQELSPTECRYVPSGLDYSDHAPILADFNS